MKEQSDKCVPLLVYDIQRGAIVENPYSGVNNHERIISYGDKLAISAVC